MIKKTAICCVIALSPSLTLALPLDPNDFNPTYFGTATIKSSGDCKFNEKVENAIYAYSYAHGQDVLLDSDYNVIAAFENNWVPLIDKTQSKPNQYSESYRSTTTLANDTIVYLAENANCSFYHAWDDSVKFFTTPDQTLYQYTYSSKPAGYSEVFNFKATGTINNFKGYKSIKNGEELVSSKSTVKIAFSAKKAGKNVK